MSKSRNQAEAAIQYWVDRVKRDPTKIHEVPSNLRWAVENALRLDQTAATNGHSKQQSAADVKKGPSASLN